MPTSGCCCVCNGAVNTDFDSGTPLTGWTASSGTWSGLDVYEDDLGTGFGYSAIQTTDADSILTYDSDIDAGNPEMRAYAAFAWQDGTNDDFTLSAAPEDCQVSVIVAYEDDNNYLEVQYHSQNILRLYEILAGTRTLLKSSALPYNGVDGNVNAWFGVYACYDGTTLRGGIAQANHLGGSKNFNPGNTPAYGIEAAATGTGGQAGISTGALSGASGLRLNCFHFRATDNRDGGGVSAGCLPCRCGPVHYHTGTTTAYTTTDLNELWEVVSGTWALTARSPTTTTGGLVLSNYDLSTTSQQYMASELYYGTPAAGSSIRLIVDAIDEDNYHCQETVFNAGGSSNDQTVNLIRRVAGVETVLATRTGAGVDTAALTGKGTNAVAINSGVIFGHASIGISGSGPYARPKIWATTTPLGGKRFGLYTSDATTTADTHLYLLEIGDGRNAAGCGATVLKMPFGIKSNVSELQANMGCSLVADEYSVEITGHSGYNGTYVCTYTTSSQGWYSSGNVCRVYFDGNGAYVTIGGKAYIKAITGTICDEFDGDEFAPSTGPFGETAAPGGAIAAVTAL